MDKATIVLNISSEVASRAEQAGLLTDEGVEKLLRAELERKENVRLFMEDIKAITAAEPTITPEEIQAEIDAYRAEQSDVEC